MIDVNKLKEPVVSEQVIPSLRVDKLFHMLAILPSDTELVKKICQATMIP